MFRISFHFGLFQFMMPIVGWLAGGQLAAYAGDYNRWVAFALLAFSPSPVRASLLWNFSYVDTATGGTKQITLETGAIINAPLFVNENDTVIVNTETGEYVERAKK